MLAAQAVIVRGSIVSSTRKPDGSTANNVARHLADDPWIVPIAGQSRIGRVAIGNQRGSALHVGLYERFDRPGGIVGDHGKADVARTCIEVFGVLASRPSLIDAAIDHLDGPDDEDFAGIAGFEDASPSRKGISADRLRRPLQWFAIRIDHRSSQLLRQQPGGLVGDAELVLHCRADIPLECVAMRCAAQNHAVSGSLERCIAVPAVIEVCRPQSRHSYKRGRLFSTAARRSLQPGQMKPSGQRRLNKNATQLASSENAFWNSESERALAIGSRSWRPHAADLTTHYI